MEPSNTIVTIQNPGEDAVVINPYAAQSAQSVAEKYGEQIKQGAFVSLAERDFNGNTVGGVILVADRVGGTLYLQDNVYLGDPEIAPSVDDIGQTVASVYAPEPVPVELETFTVFGNDDDNEDFVAVVSATEDTVYDVGVKAGLVDEGHEEDVDIVLIVKGDQSNLERVTTA